MLLSLAIAFVVTPWLARIWLKNAATAMRRTAASRRAWRRCSTASSARCSMRSAAPRAARRGHRRGDRGLARRCPRPASCVMKMLPFDNKSEFQVVVDMPAGTPLEQTAAVLHELGAGDRRRSLKSPTSRPTPAPPRRSTSTASCASTTCAAAARSATCGQPGRQAPPQRTEPRHRDARAPPNCGRSPGASAPTSRSSRCRPAAGAGALVAEVCLRPRGRRPAPGRQAGARCLERPTHGGRRRRQQTRRAAPVLTTAAAGGAPRAWQQRRSLATLRAGLGEDGPICTTRQIHPPRRPCASPARPSAGSSTRCCSCGAQRRRATRPIRELVTVRRRRREQPDLPQGPAAGGLRRRRHGPAPDSPLYGMFTCARR